MAALSPSKLQRNLLSKTNVTVIINPQLVDMVHVNEAKKSSPLASEQENSLIAFTNYADCFMGILKTKMTTNNLFW